MTIEEAFSLVYDTLADVSPEAYKAMHIIANSHADMQLALDKIKAAVKAFEER